MKPPARPNILLFVADGMQGRAVLPGHPCQTPNIDRLAARGVTITSAYTPLPTCSPARASLMTGLLPHNHGMTTVEHTVRDDESVLRADRPHFAQRIREAGYQTAYFGKWHVERSLDLHHFGWDIDRSTNGAGHRKASEKGSSAEFPLDPKLSRFQQGPPGYNDTLHYGVTDAPLSARHLCHATRDADAFIRGQHDRPWLACASYYVPNEAMLCSREYFNRYDWRSLPLPNNLHDPLTGQPNIYRRHQAIWRDVTDDQWRQALACYYARISEIDAQLGQLLDALEATGQLENTVVIVTADHGKYVGGHGMEAHNFGAFEEIYNIPMIAAGPGIAAGVTSPARVGFHDICPTVVEFADAEPISPSDARSFASLLRDPLHQAPGYTTGFAEYHGTRFLLTQRIYWEGPWKFVFNGFDFDELYNLDDDPWELSNLAAAPEQADRVKRMMAHIWQRVRDSGDRTLLNTHYYSMRFAPVGPNAADELPNG